MGKALKDERINFRCTSRLKTTIKNKAAELELSESDLLELAVNELVGHKDLTDRIIKTRKALNRALQNLDFS